MTAPSGIPRTQSARAAAEAPEPASRPERELARRFRALYAGVVYDAVRFDLRWDRPFVVDRALAPCWPAGGRTLFGHAVTCRGTRVAEPEHIDDTVRIRMFEAFSPGCVQVIDTGGDDSVAHFGDISGRIARKFGAVGAVVDGYTRDVRLLERDGFPVFCRGAQPVDAFGRWQIVEYQVQVTLAGREGPVVVRPGDYLFADADGVLLVPRDAASRICELAEARLARESEVRRELAATDDVQSLYDRIGRW
jgi:regulator of RNase E activity RraA